MVGKVRNWTLGKRRLRPLNLKREKYPLIFMQIAKSYMNTSFHLGKIHTDVDSVRHKNKIRRTYGWDCPYQDYRSNRHYNTQRHINLTH